MEVGKNADLQALPLEALIELGEDSEIKFLIEIPNVLVHMVHNLRNSAKVFFSPWLMRSSFPLM